MKKILFSIVSIFLLVSCTYDYFEDENNLKIFVPEIKDNSIRDFLILFHDKSGNFVLSKQYKSPFDADELIRNGVLRFKIPPGEYSVSCFANTYDSVKSLQVYTNDIKSKSNIQLESCNETLFKPSTCLRKILNHSVSAPFLGMPQVTDTISIDEDRVHVGQIEFLFNGLPAAVSKIDILTQNLSSRLTCDDEWLQGSPNESVFLSFIPHTTPTQLIPGVCDYFFPSVKETSESPQIKVVTRFYDSQNNLISEHSEQLTHATDENGNKIRAILLPKKKLRIIFDGFLITEIKLSEWGNIIDGDITPM